MLLRSLCFTASATIALTFFAGNAFTTPVGYFQTNLVSDIPGRAIHTDSNLKNPWGISSSSTSPFWVSDNATGVSTLYNTAGTPLPLVVSIPLPGGGMAAPTGQVLNGPGAFSDDNFLFATENGTIAGWRGALGTTAETLFDNSAAGAVYKGLAIADMGSHRYLYAADFHNNKIQVFPRTGAPALAGNFTDPNLPAGYAPFNIQKIGDNQLFVAYAKQGTGIDEDAGPGRGFVSIFDLNGNFVKRFASQGALNAPWGMAKAPDGWGMFAGDFLIGNFGDGVINAYNANGTFVGAVANGAGQTLMNDGLWGLKFGNGGNGGRPNSLYLTAGLNDESDGLFARIDPVPEPGTVGLIAAGLFLALLRRNRASA
jgi:uncharacterized protein (TIGR03118 family)